MEGLHGGHVVWQEQWHILAWKYVGGFQRREFGLFLPICISRALTMFRARVKMLTSAAFICNYRPLSMLSIPSKIMESCAVDDIKEHILQNGLVNDKQWAYKKGRSSELLLIHLTEIWRCAVESKRVVGVVFVDFMKAFDTVSRTILCLYYSGYRHYMHLHTVLLLAIL